MRICIARTLTLLYNVLYVHIMKLQDVDEIVLCHGKWPIVHLVGKLPEDEQDTDWTVEWDFVHRAWTEAFELRRIDRQVSSPGRLELC